MPDSLFFHEKEEAIIKQVGGHSPWPKKLEDDMKKKLVSIMAGITAASILMTACGKEVNTPTKNSSGEGTNTTMSGLLENLQNADSEPDTADNNHPSERLYTLDYDHTMIYVVNDRGELKWEYDLAKIVEQYSDEIEDLNPGSYRLTDNGILYFTNNHYDKQTGTSYATINAIDPRNNKTAEISRIDGSIDTFDVYDGKVWFDTCDLNTYEYKDYCFEIKEGLVFEEVDSGLDAYYKAKNGYIGIQRLRYNISNCPARDLDEVGFDMARTDKELVKIDRAGNVESVYKASEGTSPNIDYFDSDKVIFTVRDADYETLGVYSLDFATGQEKKIEGARENGYLSISGNKGYYVETQEISFGINNKKLYAYDFTDGSEKLILEEKTVPGAVLYNSLEYVGIFGTKIFITLFEDGKYVWNMIDPEDSNSEAKSLGFVAAEFSVFDYGTVEYTNSEYKCPDCEHPLNKYYGEKFVLAPEFSEHADEINRQIADYIDGNSNASVNDLMFADTTCEEHQEFPEMHTATSEDRIEDVAIIEDKYLTVTYSSYTYTGGAHGEPGREPFIFDLTTGNRLTIKDFYTGTKEQFKDMVATKIKEDYNNPASEYDYFAESEDEVYKQAYDCAELDYCVEFKADGIDYFFYPYALGPYASGFITVHISYDELLGRPTLSE